MQQLGYARYVAQGGDWGAVITRRLAEAHAEHLIGAHFNMLFAFPEDLSAPDAWEGVTPDELEALSQAASAIADGQGYSEIQGTKPQTLAYGMHDSPVAVLAWQLENDRLSPKAGDLAPDFALLDPAGEAATRLSDFRGKRPVALVFGSYT